MEPQVTLEDICAPSEYVVARQIHGSTLIIPITSGIVEVEGELFALNPTGQAIWQKLDGQRSLKEVAELIAGDFKVSVSDIESQVINFADELRRRKLLAVKGRSDVQDI
jgi:hypothetical protein